MKNKIITKRKIETLKNFLGFALQEQNKYIAINDKNEIENLNKIIFKTLGEIKTLENKLNDEKRNQYIARLNNDF
jgi:hypothetical protein